MILSVPFCPYHFVLEPFRPFLCRLFKSTATQRRSRLSTDTVPEFHTETPQATASEGLARGPYLAARACASCVVWFLLMWYIIQWRFDHALLQSPEVHPVLASQCALCYRL